MRKNLRLLAIATLSGLMALSLNSCKKKCTSDQPMARIINNGTAVASVHIQTSGGNTVNLNNVDPGTTSSYASYASGQVTFTLTVNKTDYTKTVQMANCHEYDIAIDGNNNITTKDIDRND